MRILHISTRLILGGSQENTILSCEGQARLGHDVHLAYGPIFGPEGSMLERARSFRTDDGRGITLHELPNMVRELNPLRDHFCFHRDLKNLMEGVQPDVVHTHSSKAGVLGRWAAWKFGDASPSPQPSPPKGRGSTMRPAIVHTIHGPPFMPVEGGAISRAKIKLTNKIYEIAERFAAKRCHTIVSVADAMTEQFLSRGIGAPGLYTTVRSGMEIKPYLSAEEGETKSEIRDELGLSENDFVIGTVARLAQHKGHDDILDALTKNLRSHPDWKLLWVGDGWWRDRLLAKASELGVRAQLVATGLVEPGRVPAMIRAMDVLAHPSYREGLPRTVPQALLTGVCPVAYDSDGTREACRHEETGLLVEQGDIKGLRDSIARLYDDPGLRTRLAEHGRDWCKAEFAAETMVARLEDVYRGAMVLAGRAGCAG